MISLSTELPRDPETLQAMMVARDAEVERLPQVTKELQRHRFGRRAEALPEDQLLLALEEAEHVEAVGWATCEEHAPAEMAKQQVTKRRASSVAGARSRLPGSPRRNGGRSKIQLKIVSRKGYHETVSPLAKLASASRRVGLNFCY